MNPSVLTGNSEVREATEGFIGYRQVLREAYINLWERTQELLEADTAALKAAIEAEDLDSMNYGNHRRAARLAEIALRKRNNQVVI